MPYIVYSRLDSRPMANRIRDDLRRALRAEVFIDESDMPAGVWFADPAAVARLMAPFDLVLVLIGPNFWKPDPATGEPRVCDPAAPLRVEIDTALETGKHVFAVLIDDGNFPHGEDLAKMPACVHRLARLSAPRVSAGPTYPTDIAALVGHVRQHVRRRRRWAVLAAALVLAAGCVWAFGHRGLGLNIGGPKDPAAGDAVEDVVFDKAAAAAAKILARPPLAPPPEQPHHERREALGELSNPDVDVIEDHRVWDLRGWKFVPAERRHLPVSSVAHHRRARLEKRNPEATVFKGEARTSGTEVLFSSDTHRLRTFMQPAPARVGDDTVIVRHSHADISAEKPHRPFELSVSSVYINSIQNPREQWLGIIGREGCVAISQMILFPPGRPVKSYRLTVAPPREREEDPVERPFDGDRLCRRAKDGSWVYWEIRRPKDRNVYRMHWEW